MTLSFVLFAGICGLTAWGHANLTGEVWTNIDVQLDPGALQLDAGVNLDLHLGPLVMSSESVLDSTTGWLWQEFSIAGELGGFSTCLEALFGPSTNDFLYAQFMTSLMLSGMEFEWYGAILSDAVYGGPADGWVLRLASDLFGARIVSTTEMGARIADEDFDGITIVHAASGEGRDFPVDPVVAGQGFTGQKIAVDGLPFTCADELGIDLYMTCSGFEYLAIDLKGIDVGLPWLEVDLELKYETQTKSVTVSPRIKARDSICVTPYLALAPTLNPLSFGAPYVAGVELACEWNGVRLKEIAVLDMGRYAITTEEYGSVFTARSEALESGLDFYPDFWEMISIQVDGKGCCGGDFHFLLNNYFDHDSDKLFDWAMTLVKAKIPLTSDISFGLAIDISEEGLDSVVFGVDVRW